MAASTRRRESKRRNACQLTPTAAAAASVLAATAVVFGSGGGADAFALLPSPLLLTLAGHSSCAHTKAMSPKMVNRGKSCVMVPRGVVDDSHCNSENNGSKDWPRVRAKMTPTPTYSSSPPLLPRLSQQQELSLLRRMRDYPSHSEESQSARQLLLLHNLPLVRSIVTKLLKSRGMEARRMQKTSSPISQPLQQTPRQRQMSLAHEDLLHEGTIGLAEAIDRYDLDYAPSAEAEKGGGNVEGGGAARLGTYATYWIRARVLRAMQRGEHSLLRFPEHAVQASHRLAKAAREMGLPWDEVAMLAAEQRRGNDLQDDAHGKQDSIVDGARSDVVIQNELRERLRTAAGIATDGLFRDAVRVRCMSRASSTTPLEPWMFYSPSSSDHASTAVDGIAIDDDLLGQEHIVEMLSKFLIPREVEVLSLRYGLVSPLFPSEVGLEVVDETDLLSQPAVRSGAVYRDYEAEAEEELFGPGGMLSHYSETPSSEDDTTRMSSTTNGIGQMANPSVTMAVATSNTPPSLPTKASLLPFREIGRRMEFSAEYCRRTCSAALVKLARAAEEGRLEKWS